MAAVSAVVARPGVGLRGLKAVYAASVALLALLALATLASPLLLPVLRREHAPLPEAGKIQVLAKEGEWVLQYNLLNGAETPAAFTFEVAGSPASSGGTSRLLHTASVLVDAGKSYVFIYHLLPHQAPDGTVRFTLHRNGASEPLEDLTLHLPAGGESR